MGITLIEQIGIIAGIVIGVSGFIYSVVQSRRQRRWEEEQRKREEEQAAEQRHWKEEQRRWKEEQRKREEEQAAEQRRWEEEQAAKQDVKDRLSFLSNIIIDKDIPRSSRQPFFDEYIAKGGNGTFVKFWYDEEKEAEAKRQ